MSFIPCVAIAIAAAIKKKTAAIEITVVFDCMMMI